MACFLLCSSLVLVVFAHQGAPHLAAFVPILAHLVMVRFCPNPKFLTE